MATREKRSLWTTIHDDSRAGLGEPGFRLHLRAENPTAKPDDTSVSGADHRWPDIDDAAATVNSSKGHRCGERTPAISHLVRVALRVHREVAILGRDRLRRHHRGAIVANEVDRRAGLGRPCRGVGANWVTTPRRSVVGLIACMVTSLQPRNTTRASRFR